MKKRISRIIGIGVTLALLTSLMTMALPVSALGQPAVTLGAYPNNKISYVDADYSIIFSLGKELDAGDTITVTFPSGTLVKSPYTGNATATISASPGWYGGNWTDPEVGSVTWATSSTYRTFTATLAGIDVLGEGATVRIGITAGVTNPSTPGDYTLTVKTSTETTAVTSTVYTIIAPIILPGPGTVELYNPAMILMGTYVGAGNIQDAIDDASSGYTVKVGPGSYDETVNVDEQITLTSTAGADSTIIGDINSDTAGGDVTISATGTTTYPVVVDGLTIKGKRAAGNALNILGDKVTVQNCVFTKSGSSTTTVGQTMVGYNNGAPVSGATISNCTFDTTLGAVQDTGIDVNANGLTVSGCTFTLDMTAVYQQDIAIDVAAGSSTLPVTITGCTFTGASGQGINVTGGVTSITNSTLSGLWNALLLAAGTTTVSESTVSGSGVAASTTNPLGEGAIEINGGTVTIKNSEISGSASYAFILGSGASTTTINIMFNKITDNVKNIYTSASGTLNATHNWWGLGTGPAAGTVVSSSPTTIFVDSSGYLGASASGTFNMALASLITRTSIGVDVIATGTAAPAMIGVANYATNPQAATPDPALVGGFYDVFLKEVTAGDQESVLIKFYNATITANTRVYVWSTLRGNWALCTPTTAGAAATQGVNLFSGYAWVTVTGTTIPSITELAGTPFALVEPAAPEELAVSVIKPTFGDTDVPIKPTFTWTVAGDAIGYEFVLAEELGLDDPFQIIDYSATSTTNGHVAREELKYSTTYWWRVRASSATATGDWVVSFFTTEDEPEEAPPPVEIVEEVTEPPVITIEIPPAVEKVTSAIPDWALYTIIAVGAVLIIAVIVLIVRTRRVA